MNYTDITYETDDRLAFVTLNRPEKLNALSNNLRGEVDGRDARSRIRR